MKNLIRKTALAASLILAVAATSFKANAQDKLVYDKTHNTAIGITIANATGADYVIKDKRGNIIYRGTVKSDKTFYIPTSKLGKGEYQFQIGCLVLQEFVIK